ncbi:MAG: CRISPR-associated endonuclease Cas1, partial [bacterium]
MIGGGPSNAGDLLPIRMLNEYAYCPRLFHFMHVEGRWADNAFTVQGRNVHRRTDKLDHVLPDAVGGASSAGKTEGATASSDAGQAGDAKDQPAGDKPPAVSRSVVLGSEQLGLTGKLDLVATDSDEAIPVETKRGRVPNTEQRCYEPERVQLMAQGLLLREHGYTCKRGALYFAGSRTRVDVPFTAELEARTRELATAARQAAADGTLPPPLDDSPKCHGCSLAGICLPDETRALSESREARPLPDVRRLFAARDEAVPLYVQEQGARVGKSGESLVVRKRKEQLARVPRKDVSQLVLCGSVGVSAQALNFLCQEGVPVVHLTTGHWFCGITTGITLKNAFVRAAQFKAAESKPRCLQLARAVVAAKGANQRTILRRNGQTAARLGASAACKTDLGEMSELLVKAAQAKSAQQLLGLEGNLAARYYANFAAMLSPRDFDADWDFTKRTRRPPTDPVNAMLSFGYALLAKECTVATLTEGLDPWWGLYHRPRHGRPALALDLMEEFRPIVVDSAVI